MKLLITGGSGFIGTNLLSHFQRDGINLMNIDFKEPRNRDQLQLWNNVDITDATALEKVVLGFQPDYIVHLAARTDLDGKSLEDYSANPIGAQNILNCCHKLPGLKKVLFTSSILVRGVGYEMKHVFDYHPTTLYGESKVETERIVLANPPKCDWAILRPTSIWGPWFRVPYRNFFDMVIGGKYLHFGKKASVHTYGYVGNSVYQIEKVLMADTSMRSNDKRVFLLGDEPAYNIEEWANEIAGLCGKKIPRIPYWLIKCAAWFGDVLKFFGINFPMTSFRLKNMTTDNIMDVSATYEIAPNPPFSREDGVKVTLGWMKQEK